MFWFDVFDGFPFSGVTPGAFEGGCEFPFFGVINATVKAEAFIGIFFPFMSLLNLHVAMVG